MTPQELMRMAQQNLNAANRREQQVSLDVANLKSEVAMLRKIVEAIIGVLTPEQVQQVKDKLGVKE